MQTTVDRGRARLQVHQPNSPMGTPTHLRRQLGAVLQHSVEDLHIVGIPGIREFIKNYKLDGGAQVVFVGIQQLPRCKNQSHGEELGRTSCLSPSTHLPVAHGLCSSHIPEAQHVVVQEHLGLEADLDQVGDDIHVFWAVCAAVHTHGHQQVLGWPGQLQRSIQK